MAATLAPPQPDTTWSPPDPTTRRRPPRSRRTKLWLAAGTAATIASAFVGNEALLAIPILFAISWPLERIWRRHPVPVRRIGLRTDLAYAAAQVPMQLIALAVGVVLAIVSLAWLPGLLLRPLVTALPTWLQIVTGIVAFDVLVYWAHRWMHTVPLLWRFHSIHHSTIHLDWVSGFRNHPLDGVFIAPAAAFLIGAGLDNRFVGALAVVQFVTGLWAHLNVRWRLRPLRAIVLTPDFHHWHHANEPEAINTNFSVFLPIWDILFGSYYMPSNKRPMRYGVNDPVPQDLTGQLLYPFRGMRTAIRGRRNLRRAARS